LLFLAIARSSRGCGLGSIRSTAFGCKKIIIIISESRNDDATPDQEHRKTKVQKAKQQPQSREWNSFLLSSPPQ
jgi:hypothetical protein